MTKRFHLTPPVAKNAENSLRFGLMLNSLTIEAWQAQTIQLLVNEGHELVLTILNHEQLTKVGLGKKLREYPYNQIFFRIWNRFLFRPQAKKATDISSLTQKSSKIYCLPHRKGIGNHIQNQDIATIKSYNLDFILRFGFNILHGDVLNAAKYGIWSFHHDDEQKIRGGPPGFWEFIGKHSFNAVILQKLTEKLDKGIVLKKVFYPVIYHSYKAHLNQIYFESSILPLQLCREMVFQPLKFEPSGSKAPVFYPPSNRMMMHYLFVSAQRRLWFHIKDIFTQEDWHIGFMHNKPILEKDHFQHSDVSWLPRQTKSSYLADPFYLETEKDHYIIAEKFDYSNGKGNIVLLKRSENFNRSKVLIDSDLHYSFPFVFRYRNEVFCLPECHQNSTLQLFRFDETDEKLLKSADLLEGFAVVDPILFQHENRWWLFFTSKLFPSVHLYAFYADSLFGEFKPHHLNPVKTDIRSSRNAGAVFSENEQLIRPAQDCSDHYGRAVNLCWIKHLSPETFEETVVYRVSPDETLYTKGLHTFNLAAGKAIVDGKRYVFTFTGFMHQLRSKLKIK